MRPVFSGPFPIFSVRDVARAAAFYTEAFGFEQNFRWPEDPAELAEFMTLTLDGREIGFGHATGDRPPFQPHVEFCLEVTDIDAAWTWLMEHDATAVQPPTRQPWGESNAYVADPDGLRIHIYCREGSAAS